MKRWIWWLVIVISVVVVVPSFAADSVRVRGHVRKDGTYVQPHYRTASDGSFYNNWSTKGNYNPYTGEDGKVLNPPLVGGNGTYSLSTTPSYTPRLPSPSYAAPSVVAPRISTESPSDFVARYDRESRERAASRLRELGVNADPERESFLSLNDKESRVRTAHRIRELGHEVDWQKNSFLELYDMESRIRTSKRIKELGHAVDWQTHSFLNLYDMESRIRTAQRLKQKGVEVDWQKYSFMQLIDMENQLLLRRSSR